VFGISIALEEHGHLAHGAVFSPATGELFCASAGEGFFVNGRRASMPRKESFAESLWSTGDIYERGVAFERANAQLKRIYRRCRAVRICGSVAMQLAYVAAGKLDGFWFENVNLWDVLAGVLLIREAGGEARTFEGDDFTAQSTSLVAGHGTLVEKAIEIIGARPSPQPPER
jgi:myo-inositol-1(or 4)-monophosphatase